jgi:hypothetical protein
MVGDRADVDGAGAIAAGLPCLILGPQPSQSMHHPELLGLASFEELRRVLDDND